VLVIFVWDKPTTAMMMVGFVMVVVPTM